MRKALANIYATGIEPTLDSELIQADNDVKIKYSTPKRVDVSLSDVEYVPSKNRSKRVDVSSSDDDDYTPIKLKKNGRSKTYRPSKS